MSGRAALPAPPVRLVAPLRVERFALGRGARSAGLAAGAVVRAGAGSRARLPAGEGPVAVLGVGGSLRADVRPGHVVVATAVTGPGGRRLTCPSAPLLAAALRRHGCTVHLEELTSSRRLVVTASRRQRLASSTGAAAVDMESFGLLESAGDVPLAAVRVIVDAPGAPLFHPGTVRRGTAALRTLARVIPAVYDWAAAAGAREVVLAEPRSFCAGVERAITTVERAIDLSPGPVYVRRQVVHNAHVVAGLAQRGAVFITELDEAPEGATVVLSAHGVSPEVREEAERRRMHTIDATCPLVAKVHAEARHARGRGDTTVLIGHADHEEVVGTVGEAPDTTMVVASVAEAATLHVPDGRRVTWLAQTTLAVDETQDIVDVLTRRFPEGRGQAASDICYATTNRQSALRQVAAGSDLVLVVGSDNSSNSHRLVEVSVRAGTVAHLVEDAAAVDPAWLIGVGRVGVTAGASAPPHLVDALVRALRGLGPVTTSTAGSGPEDITFDLPKEIRIP